MRKNRTEHMRRKKKRESKMHFKNVQIHKQHKTLCDETENDWKRRLDVRNECNRMNERRKGIQNYTRARAHIETFMHSDEQQKYLKYRTRQNACDFIYIDLSSTRRKAI